jgi:hypothetical protein
MKFADGNGYTDIIIYIIIMAVGLIANAYRNASKKKEMENRQPGDVIPDFPEVEFEPAIDYGEPEISTQSEYPAEPAEYISTLDTVPEPDNNLISNEANLLDTPGTEGEAVFQNTINTIISDQKYEMENAFALAESSEPEISKGEIGREEELPEEVGFDLERAVINSVLLHTKYFSNSY